MAVTVQSYIARLLSAYENATGERHSKIAGEMDIPVSNYYLYRNGMGNPTGNTDNKIVTVIQMNRPKILIETTEWILQQLMQSVAPDEEKTFVLF